MNPLLVAIKIIELLEAGELSKQEIAQQHPDWVKVLKDNGITIEKA